MKKLLVTIAALCFSTHLALASSIAPVTGAQDPSQLNAIINNLINSIQSGVNGFVGGIVGTVASSATTAEQTLASVTIPANTLSKQGQSLRVRCSGYFSGAQHASTSAKVYFGTSSFSTGNVTTGSQSYDIDLLVTYNAGATSAVQVGRGTQGSTAIAVVATANTTDDMTTNLVAKCTATQGTASASDVVNQNFIIEQIK